MAEGVPGSWVPEGAWAGILSAGRLGEEAGPAGLRVEPLESLTLALLQAAPDAVPRLGDRLEIAFGLRPPARPEVVAGSGATFVWSGPGTWLVASEQADLPTRLAREAGVDGSVVDATGSRALLRLSGPRVRDALAKGCPVDLHPRAFPEGAVAMTVIAHVGVQLWRLDGDGFLLAVPRSYAGSLWSWLLASAAEFGIEVAAQPG